MIAFVSLNSYATTTPLDNTVTKDLSIAHDIQNREQAWDQERAILVAKLAQLQAQRDLRQTEVDALLWSNNRQQKQVDKLQMEIDKANQLTEGVAPIITTEAQRAASIYDNSLPFLQQERRLRLTALNDWLKAPSTEQAEKLERLLEFFTIEAQFGHTSESWQQQIDLNQQQIAVQLLKVGRLALFYQTLDEHQCGAFNPETQAFEPLNDNHCGAIQTAIELANRQRSAELVKLPIGGVHLQ